MHVVRSRRIWHDEHSIELDHAGRYHPANVCIFIRGDEERLSVCSRLFDEQRLGGEGRLDYSCARRRRWSWDDHTAEQFGHFGNVHRDFYAYGRCESALPRLYALPADTERR